MLVARFHGEAEAEKAREGFKSQFAKKAVPDDIEEVVVYAEQPTMRLPNVMVQSGLTDTTSSARRDIKGGGVRVDETKVLDVNFVMSVGDEHLLQRGKRHFKKVRIESK